MNELEFARLRLRMEAWLAHLQSSLRRHPCSRDAWSERIGRAQSMLDSEATLRLVLVGEWDAGKSTLVRALTGAQVQIDADVSTSRAEAYEWRGITLVDTPGVHSEREPSDHDAIARAETVDADLVLCVVTNELFSPRLAQHFAFLASPEGLGLSGKLAVVVNKMDRESGSDEVIIAEVDRSIAPYTDTPIFLCAAKKWVDLQEGACPEKLRDRFAQASRMAALTTEIDHFVRARGALGRLARPVQEAVDLITDAKGALGEGDDAAQRQLELIRRKRRVLARTKNRLFDAANTTISRTRAVVLAAQDNVLHSVTGEWGPEEIETATVQALEGTWPQVDSLLEAAAPELQDIAQDCQTEMSELDDTPLGLEVATAAAKHGKATVDATDERPWRVAAAARAGQVRKALDGLARNPTVIRDTLLKAGGKLGKKFRPWQATKAAGKIAKALPLLGVALEAILIYRGEREDAARRRHLTRARLAIARTFREQAETEAKAVNLAFDEMLGAAIRNLTADLDREETAALQRQVTPDYLVELDSALSEGRALQAEIFQLGPESERRAVAN